MLEKLEQSIKETTRTEAPQLALLNKNNYQLHEIKRDNWKAIPAGSESAIAFVDGGNAEVVKTPAAELHRIRTAVIFTYSNKMAKARQKEGYLLARAVVGSNGKVSCEAEFFESSLDKISDGGSAIKIESNELADAIPENDTSAALGKAAGDIRRLCEIAAAKWAAKELGKNKTAEKLVVLDGTLEAFTETERKEILQLIAEAKESNAAVGALAKTCSLLTTSGDSVIAATENIAKESGYLCLANGKTGKHNAAVAVARLNSNSSHLFRVESAGDVKELLSALKSQSNDLAFPGYPYGLIMADRLARISNNESELLKTKITAMAAASSKLKMLISHAKSLDAHGVLDRMQF